jgi:very-short-patch-repair endonuclease
LLGVKFRRQAPLGRYIVDFACLEYRLVLELYGGQHADRCSADEQRDAWLRAHGFRVLRFWNHEVMENLSGVLGRIVEELRGASDRKLPSPALRAASPACGRGENP